MKHREPLSFSFNSNETLVAALVAASPAGRNTAGFRYDVGQWDQCDAVVFLKAIYGKSRRAKTT